jgi:hypothetical protein
MRKVKIFLPDINMAVRWFQQLGGDELAFCRVSQMGHLRLLTNARVMGADVLRSGEAWRVYEEVIRDSRIRFLVEPGGIEVIWKGLTEKSAPSAWTMLT